MDAAEDAGSAQTGGPLEKAESSNTLAEAILSRLKTFVEYISVVGVMVGGFGYPAVLLLYTHLKIPLRFSTHETAIRAGVFPALLFIIWVVVVTPRIAKAILEKEARLLELVLLNYGFAQLAFLVALLLILQDLFVKMQHRFNIGASTSIWSWIGALACVAALITLIWRFRNQFGNMVFAILFSDLENPVTSRPLDTTIRSIVVGGLISFEVHRLMLHFYGAKTGQSLAAHGQNLSVALPAAIFCLISASFAYCAAATVLEPTLTSTQNRPINRRMFPTDVVLFGWKCSNYQLWLYVAQFLVFLSASAMYSAYAYPKSPEILGGGRPMTACALIRTDLFPRRGILPASSQPVYSAAQIIIYEINDDSVVASVPGMMDGAPVVIDRKAIQAMGCFSDE